MSLIEKSGISSDQVMINQGNLKVQLKGLFSWVKVLARINDTDLKAICGTDAALYLVFIRYCFKFLGLICILNLLIVIPIYLTGSPVLPADDNEGIPLISRITIMNITNSPKKAIGIFLLIFLFYTTSTCFLIFFYWKKSIHWRYRQHSHLETFYDHDIALHTIYISNIPVHIALPEM